LSNFDSNRVGALSDQGPVRPANEDHFWVTNGQMPNHLGELYIVADGVGGQEHGAAASQMATQVISQSFYAARQKGASIVNSLSDAIMDANEAIFQESQRRGPGKMGSTLVTAVQHNDHVIIAHIGDARAYLLQGRKLRRLTKDDTWVQKQVDAGIISKEAAEKHELRNVVTQVLGNKPEINVHISEPHEFGGSDILMLCSDGVYDVIDNEHLYRTLKDLPPQQAAESLVQQAIANGTRDNVTAVVVRSGSPPNPDDTARETRLSSAALSKNELEAAYSEPAQTVPLTPPPELTQQETAASANMGSGPEVERGFPRWAIYTIIGVVIVAILLVLGMLIMNSDSIGIRLSSGTENQEQAAGDSADAVNSAIDNETPAGVMIAATATVTVPQTIVITPTPLPPTETAVPPTTSPTIAPLPTSTPIPIATVVDSTVPAAAPGTEQRACIVGRVFVWSDEQVDSPECEPFSDFPLENSTEVIILPLPPREVLSPATSINDCQPVMMRRIETIVEPVGAGWVLSSTLQILPPGESCQP
jgi:serine/threonine protein phosphatase PrpC